MTQKCAEEHKNWHLALENSKKEKDAEVSSLKTENENLRKQMEKLATDFGRLREVSYTHASTVGAEPGLQDSLSALVKNQQAIVARLNAVQKVQDNYPAVVGQNFTNMQKAFDNVARESTSQKSSVGKCWRINDRTYGPNQVFGGPNSKFCQPKCPSSG